MFPAMSWFVPLALGIGLYGMQTATVEKRFRGGRWRIDSILLAMVAWFPLMVWIAAWICGPME